MIVRSRSSWWLNGAVPGLLLVAAGAGLAMAMHEQDPRSGLHGAERTPGRGRGRQMPVWKRRPEQHAEEQENEKNQQQEMAADSVGTQREAERMDKSFPVHGGSLSGTARCLAN